MTIDDRSRHELHDALERALGNGPADTLMAHLPPSGWGELATKHDLDLTRAATQGDLAVLSADLRLEMAALREELRGEMVELREELRGEMAALREELRGEMAALREELADLRVEVSRGMQRQFLALTGLMVTLNAALVGLVAVLA